MGNRTHHRKRLPRASAKQVMTRLRRMANPANAAGMARFGINSRRTLGIAIPTLRKLARELGSDHVLAQKLWASGIHEARILASFIDQPRQVTAAQMDRWVKAFDSWDVCDQVCGLFERTPWAGKKIRAWAADEREYVKRAAFAMIAGLAVHHEAAHDHVFEPFLRMIRRGATDERNFVKKAVNWALRSIGKRNRRLNRRAIAVARGIGRLNSPAARWVAAAALRELTSTAVQRRLLTASTGGA
jgi:3-methyladenine DNA glycosylase AlkD